jgi:hypothetical protein
MDASQYLTIAGLCITLQLTIVGLYHKLALAKTPSYQTLNALEDKFSKQATELTTSINALKDTIQKEIRFMSERHIIAINDLSDKFVSEKDFELKVNDLIRKNCDNCRNKTV